ncbi:hypothetical protein KL921_004134 [Ogataea angusta]|nr:hypothetical protein KL921_004134 [Ogataea angusta]
MRQETAVLVSKLCTVVIAHYLLNTLLPHTRVPTIVSAVLASSAISQSPMFLRLRQRLASLAAGPAAVSQDRSRSQLLRAVNEMRQYLARGKAWNEKKRQLYKTMSWRQQKIVAQTGYQAKMNKVDATLAENYKLLQDCVARTVRNYNISTHELKLAADQARLSPQTDHHKVIEGLCHFARDWSPAFDREVVPILDYVRTQLARLDLAKTTVVVPGSGLGRVAHEIAQLGAREVVSVEYSWYMLLLNEFVYADSPRRYQVYPYVHNYSNHVATQNQFRAVELRQRAKPANLSVQQGDFTSFTAARLRSEPHHVAIVTCFFLDTAENLMDYFDAVARVADAARGDVLWVNVGPLKYGTAAKAELSHEEIRKLRSVCGWQLVDECPRPELLGYLTDTEGLWQGYYGVTMWTCKRAPENM